MEERLLREPAERDLFWIVWRALRITQDFSQAGILFFGELRAVALSSNTHNTFSTQLPKIKIIGQTEEDCRGSQIPTSKNKNPDFQNTSFSTFIGGSGMKLIQLLEKASKKSPLGIFRSQLVNATNLLTTHDMNYFSASADSKNELAEQMKLDPLLQHETLLNSPLIKLPQLEKILAKIIPRDLELLSMFVLLPLCISNVPCRFPYHPDPPIPSVVSESILASSQIRKASKKQTFCKKISHLNKRNPCKYNLANLFL